MLSSILKRLMPSRSAVVPHVCRWICIIPTESLSEIANGFPPLSTMMTLAIKPRVQVVFASGLHDCGRHTVALSGVDAVFFQEGFDRSHGGIYNEYVTGLSTGLLPSRLAPKFEKKTELGDGKAKRRLAQSAVRINNLDERETHCVHVTVWSI